MKLFLSILLGALFFSCSVSQKTEPSTKSVAPKNYPAPSKDWTEGNCPCEGVSMYLMEDQEPPNWFKLEGEAILDLPSNIVSMDKIPGDVYQKIKARVQKAGGCIAFVDLRDYYGSETFPMREDGEVYFYWGKCN